MSGLDGKRMRPVPGLVDALRESVCPRERRSFAVGAESGPAFRPSADLPSRKAASVRVSCAIGAVLYDRRSTVSSELARTRGIRLSN